MASKLLKGGTVISFNESSNSLEILQNTSILIKGGKIAAISSELNEKQLPKSTEIIDVGGRIISPGFVNTHQHFWQTAYRGSFPNCSLAEYFQNGSQFSATKDAYSPDDIYISYLAGICEALNAGVTSTVDHAHNQWNPEVMKAGLDAAKDSGARIWYCYEPFAARDPEGQPQYESWKELAAKHPRQDLVRLGIACDHPYDQSAAKVKSLVKELDLEVITSHFLGGPWPFPNNPDSARKHGLLDTATPVILSHAGLITQQERQVLRETNQYISITPESEMHYGHGQETSDLIADHASLGVDTTFIFSGDLITQARIWLQTQRLIRYNKTIAKRLVPRESPMGVYDAFLLATRQGGLALRRKDIGVIQVGAQADLAIFSCDSPNMVGVDDPVAAIILHANAADIEHVLIGGEFRKRDGKLVTKTRSWNEISNDFKKTAAKVHEASRDRSPLPDKFFGYVDFGDAEKVTLSANKSK